MTAPPRPPGDRLYRLLLRLHTRAFLRRHGEELVEHFREEWEETVRGPGGVRAAIAFWVRTLHGVIGTALAQRLGPRDPTSSSNEAGEGGMRMEVWLSELRIAARSLVRRPTMTVVVVLTLGVGLGANTAVFSVLQSVLVAPLPYRDAGRLVRIYANRRDRPGDFPKMFLSNPATTELRDGVAGLSGVAVLANYSPEFADVTGGSAPERVRILRVSASYFDVLGAAPILGAPFGRAEENADSRSVLVRESLWERYLGGSRDAIGRSLTLDGEAFTVVGVLSDGFSDPLEGRVDVWVPEDLTGDQAGNWDNSYLSVVARLAPGADPRTLRTELDLVEAHHDAIGEDAAEKGYTVVPLRDDVVGAAEPVLNAVMGAVLFLLLLTCVNVASVLVASGSARQREMAIRASVGSPRSGLVRLFLFEAVLLAAAGGGVGFALGSLALRALLAVAPAGIPRLDEVALGWSTLAVGGLFAIGVGLVLGLATALTFTRAGPGTVLGSTRASGPGPAAGRVRRSLVSVQVALAVLLLVGAGVLLRTLEALRDRDLGADPSGVLTYQVGLPSARYGRTGAERAFYDELLERVADLPGVTSTAATTRLPVTGNYNTWGTRPATAVDEPVDMDNIQVNQRWVLGDFFRTAGLELVAGRTFEAADDEATPKVVVVNQALARALFPGEDPLGHLLRIGGRYPRIVGVVEDEALTARAPARPIAYHSLLQWDPGGRTLWQMVRVVGDPTAAVPAVRSVLAAIDPELVLFRARAMREVIVADIARERFAATLLTTFAALAGLLAALGLYGVLVHVVARRRQELGVRLALGADAHDLRAMVVGQGLRLTAIGVAFGVPLAVALTRLLDSLLFGVSAHDPTVLAVVPLVLLGLALAASYLPASRATRVDPVESLRAE